MEPAHGDYCPGHSHECAVHHCMITFDPLLDFYTDPANITFGESALLKKIMAGVMIYCRRRKDVDEALLFFDIHAPSGKRIQARYRELACKYHPDRNGGSEEMMKKLNSAYMILKEMYVAP